MTSVATTAIVFPGVVLGRGVVIEDFVRVGGAGDGPPALIGDNTVLRSGTVVYDGAVLGENVQTGHHVVVRARSRIGNGSVIGTHAVIDGDVEIGKRVRIQTAVYVPPGTVIEDDCFLGPHATLTNDRPMGSYVRGLIPRDQPLRGPTIRRAVRIGAQAVVFPGIEIGQEAVVGAGAVVTASVPPRAVVVGVPARAVGTVDDEQLLSEGER